MNIPIYVTIGTRAQFIKVAPLLRMMIDQGMKYELIFTAQHRETIDEILKVYKLPPPDKIMYKHAEANTRPKFLTWFLSVFKECLFHSKKWLPKKGILMSHGDTFTTWMTSLMGRLRGCKVAHLESGLRSFNLFRPFPEEISRLLTFSFTNIYFCETKSAYNNIKKYKGDKIILGTNTIYDAVEFALKSKHKTDFSFQRRKYVIFSIHRYENIFTSRLTNKILPWIHKVSKDILVVITLHPTTRERLIKLNLFDKLKKTKNIVLHKRFDFLDWINVCRKAEFVVSDGGSNQEEFAVLGIPALLFRTETERKDGLGRNIVLSMLDNEIISKFVNNYKKYKRGILKLKYTPCQMIIDYLKKLKYSDLFGK
jgi:UDP-N-acetylglucosamine 2-epimerase (non-hydrolysing)